MNHYLYIFFRFVEFKTVREAENAMQLLHNKDMGRGVQLIVKVSESKKSQGQRMKQKMEDNNFLNTLHCSRKNICDDDAEVDNDLNEDETEKLLSNPLQPKYMSSSPKRAMEDVSEEQNLSSSGDAGSLNASSEKSADSGETFENVKNGDTFSPASVRENGSDDESLKLCIVCQKPTASRCSECKTAYCNIKCQREDWPKHRLVCRTKSSNVTHQKISTSAKPHDQTINSPKSSNSELLKIADNSDDEGFVVSCPTEEDLIPVKMMLQQVQDGRPLEFLKETNQDHSQSSIPSNKHLSSAGVQPPTPSSKLNTKSLPLGGELGASVTEPLSSIKNKELFLTEVMPSKDSLVGPFAEADPITLSPRPPCSNPFVSTADTFSCSSAKISNLSHSSEFFQLPQLPRTNTSFFESSSLPVDLQKKIPFLSSLTSTSPFVTASTASVKPYHSEDNQSDIISVKPHFISLDEDNQSVKPHFNGQDEDKQSYISSVKPFTSLDEDSIKPHLSSFDINSLSDIASVKPHFSSLDEDNQLEKMISLQSIYAQYGMLPQPLPSLPLASFPPLEFSAIITYYDSCTQFSVIIPSVESKQALRSIHECGQNLQPGTIVLSRLSVGSKCGYMNKDGSYIRVTIRKITSPEDILVHRYDLDGTCSVRASELNHLPEDIVLIPCLSWRCSLKNIFISDLGRENFSLAYRALQELVGNKPVMIKNLSSQENPKARSIFCSLMTMDGCVGLSEALLQSSPYVCSKSSSQTLSDSLKLVNYSSKIPFHLVLENTSIKITPTVVTNPNIIWAQVQHPQLSNVEKMHKDLDVCYSSQITSSLYVPVVGEICVAKYSYDQKYYRAEVVCINHGGTVDIRFVESGRMETVTVSQLHHIQPIFLTLPKQARKFSMAGVVPAQSSSWSENAIAFLKEKILNRSVKINVISVLETEIVVEMYDPDLKNQLLNNSLILFGHAEAAKDIQEETPLSSSLIGVTITSKSAGSKVKKDGTLQLSYWSPSAFDGASAFTSPLTSSNDYSPVINRSPLRSISPLRSQTSPSTGSSHRKFTKSLSPVKSLSGITKLDSAGFGEEAKKRKNSSETVYSCCTSLSEDEKMRDYFSFEKLLLSVGDLVRVSVSQVTDPSKFHVQLIEPSNKVKVQKMLASISQLERIPMKITPGKFCLCLFSEDNCVHRAKILHGKKTCTVFFIDYGDIYNAKSSDIYEITPELMQFPAQAIMCSLDRISNPAGKTAEWDPAAIERFKDIIYSGSLKMKVVKVVGHLHVINLTVSTTKGNKDVLQMMCEEGLCQSFKRTLSEPNNRSLSASTTGLDKMINSQSEGKITMSPIKDKSESIREMKLPSFKIPGEINCLYPLVSNIEKISLPQGSSNVVVSEIVNLEEFYVQLLTTGTVISKVSDILGSYFKSGNPGVLTDPPPVGSLCCAKFSQDKMWYRCEVLAVNQDMVSVKFVDYGNRDIVPLFDLAACPVQCLSLPLVAVKCCLGVTLSGMSPTDQAVTFLKQHTADCILSAQVVGDRDGVPQLKLKAGERNLVDEIIEQFSLSSKNSHPLVAGLTKMRLPESAEEFRIMVSEIVSPGEMYVQLATQEVGVLLNEITDGINSALQSGFQPLPSPPEVGSLCCAKFSLDMTWYRVEVLQVNDTNCSVFFVDYGNTDAVSLSNMAVCPLKLASLPLIAVRCGLNGAPFGLSSMDKIIEFLKQHTSENLVSAKIIGEVDGIPQVELVDKGTNLLNKMVEVGIVRLTPTLAEQALPLVADMEKTILPESPSIFKVLVVEVAALNELYLQVATPKIGASLSEVIDGINALFDSSSSPSLLSSPPATGSLCCAKFSQDSTWYRAKVVEIKDDLYTVLFLDFGNKDHLPLSSLAVCPSQFAEFPILAVKCGLSGLSPTAIFDEASATNFLRQHTTNVLLSAKLISTENGIPLIELHNEKFSLLDEMIRLGIVSMLPLASTLKELEFPHLSSPLKVAVFGVISLSEFYLQVDIKETSVILGKISEVLGSFDKIPLSSPPGIGSVCCTKFYEDNSWCRVEVMALNADKCKVFFLDYGNIEYVSTLDLVLCPSELLSLPKVAVKCGLSSVIPQSSTSKQAVCLLKELTSDCMLSAKYISVSNGVPQIELVKGEKNLLLQLGLESVSPPYPMVASMARLKLPETSEPFQLLVCEIVTPHEVYVQVYNENSIQTLSTIAGGLKCHFESHPNEVLSQPPSVGSLCCTKFSQDGLWYRARVDSVNGSAVKVCFVDFGNSEESKLDAIARCPPNLAKLPIVAIKCALHGISNSTPPKWSNESVKLLKKLTLDRLLQACVVSSLTNEVPVVQLVDNINNSLISAKFLEMQQSNEPSLRRCQVTEINDPFSFYIQIIEKENSKDLSLLNELQKVYANPTCYEVFQPVVGSLCCAKHFSDNCWYRCEVIAISKQVVTVRYIDFGVVDTVLQSKIYRLDDAFFNFPPLAIHCKLSNVKPTTSGKWSGNAVEKFKSICGVDYLYVSVVGEEQESISSVNLYVDLDSAKSVADNLVSSGYAVYN